MDLSKIHAVIADDDIIKAFEIRRALEYSGITDVDIVSDQEKLWERIYGNGQNERKPDLIVTDMQYSLTAGADVDKEAGFKLMERMEKEHICIPIIICSSGYYENVPGVLGTVWYTGRRDINPDFKGVLGTLKPSVS